MHVACSVDSRSRLRFVHATFLSRLALLMLKNPKNFPATQGRTVTDPQIGTPLADAHDVRDLVRCGDILQMAAARCFSIFRGGSLSRAYQLEACDEARLMGCERAEYDVFLRAQVARGILSSYGSGTREAFGRVLLLAAYR